MCIKTQNINENFGNRVTVMHWYIYIYHAYTILTLNFPMAITLYETSDIFICTTIFGLSESSSIALFKYLDEKIFKGKVAENYFFFTYFLDFELNYIRDNIFK